MTVGYLCVLVMYYYYLHTNYFIFMFNIFHIFIFVHLKPIAICYKLNLNEHVSYGISVVSDIHAAQLAPLYPGAHSQV